MNISALDGGNAAATEIARKKLGEEAPAREKQPASPAAQEDTVNISEEGKEKAATLTMRSQDEGGDADTAPGDGDESGAAVSTDALKKELQLKKSEITQKQAQLDSLARQAETDPSRQAELQKLKSKVGQLEKEEAKLKSQMYSA